MLLNLWKLYYYRELRTEQEEDSEGHENENQNLNLLYLVEIQRGVR